MTIREDIHKHQWFGNADDGYLCKLDLHIHCPEPDCLGVMKIVEAWRETSVLLVVTVECKICHYIAGLSIVMNSQEETT